MTATLLPAATAILDAPRLPSRRELRAQEPAAPVLAKTQRSQFFFPAVDGMRGIAIASVLLFHTNWSPRGLFGVDVFFVVSGFLITLLLLRELHTRGSIRLGSFYKRRAKRLVPGLLITLGLTLLLVWQFGSLQQLESAATKALYSLLQIANWQQLSSNEAYWEATGQIQPLAHMWSLSLTEQFYIVWPLVMLTLWWMLQKSPLALMLGLVVLTAGSALVAPLLWDESNSDRLYLGTDARAVGFVAGAAAAAAVFWHLSRRHARSDASPSTLRRIAITGLSTSSLGVVLVASILTTSYHEPWLYQGGFALVAICAAVFTATLTSDANALTKFFSFSLFTAFGKVSYAVYLLHLPVFWLLQQLTPSIDPLLLFFVGGGLTWLLGAFMHYALTERMRLAHWKWTRGIPAVVIGTALVAGMGYYLPQARTAQAQSTAFDSTVQNALNLTPGQAGGRPVVLTLGDSLAVDFAAVLTDHGTGAFAVHNGGVGGCGIMSPQQVRATSGYIWENQTQCGGWEQRYQQKIGDTQPDFIVVHATWDAADQLIDGTWMRPGDAEYNQRLLERLTQISTWAAELSPHTQILISNDRLTNGIITDPAQMNTYNALVAQFVGTSANAHLLDLNGGLCPDGTCSSTDTAGNELFLDDNVHLSAAGMTALAPWLEQAIAGVQRE